MNEIITQERQALPLRFNFGRWGWKWLYLAAFIGDILAFYFLMQRDDKRGLFGAMMTEPWLLWLFSLLGAQIALVGVLMWEDAWPHRMNRFANVGIYYVLGSFWLFVYLLLRIEPADARPISEVKFARPFAATIALAMLALTVYTVIVSPISTLFATWQQYPGDIYYAVDTACNILFAAPLLIADAQRRGLNVPVGYIALMFLLGPFGLALWLWQRPPLHQMNVDS